MDTAPKTRVWTIRSADDLGRAIAGIRKEAGLSQEALAQQTRLHRPQISQLESGKAPMVVDRILRMLRRMGATVTITIERSS